MRNVGEGSAWSVALKPWQRGAASCAAIINYIQVPPNNNKKLWAIYFSPIYKKSISILNAILVKNEQRYRKHNKPRMKAHRGSLWKKKLTVYIFMLRDISWEPGAGGIQALQP